MRTRRPSSSAPPTTDWLDFTIAFILCLGQLGLLGDSGDPVEDRPPAHESDPNDPNDYKKGATADALRKSWARRQQQKFAILIQLTRGCPEAALIFQDFEVSDFNGVYTALIKEFEATNENRHTAMQKATQLAVGPTPRSTRSTSQVLPVVTMAAFSSTGSAGSAVSGATRQVNALAVPTRRRT